MQCHRCGGDNQDDYRFCIHCGSPREAVISLGDASLQSPSVVAETPQPTVEHTPEPKKPSHALVKKKWFLALLILVPLLCCMVVLAVAVLVLVTTGTISLGSAGDHILLGFTNRSNRTDLYMLRLGEEPRQGTVLVEDALLSRWYLNYYQDGEAYRLGSYYQQFGGFVPEQKLLVIWYEDEEGNVYIQRQSLSQDSPTQVFSSQDTDGYGRVLNDGQDIFINAEAGGDERCYVSSDGEAAQRITTGDTCNVSTSGAYLLTTRIDGEELTLTKLNLDGSQEVTLIAAQKDVDGYRVSYDGTRIAYASGAGPQQVILQDGNAAMIAQSEAVYRVLDYDFAAQANTLHFIAENDEGELQLFLLDESGQTLVATGFSLQAQLSRDGDYLIYSSGDENQGYTVNSYDINRRQSTQILHGINIRLSLADGLERVFITQQDDGELTVFSAALDGSGLVQLFSDHDAFHGIILYHPYLPGIFIQTYDNDGENSLFYTPVDEDSGYYLFKEYVTLEVKDISPDGNWLLLIANQNYREEPALSLIRLAPDQTPLILDEGLHGFTTAVFSQNGKEVYYTALTGGNYDEREVRLNSITGEQPPETIYQRAHLVDVQWTQIFAFNTILFPEPLESTSYCPGAQVIHVGNIMEGTLTEDGAVCYRFNGNAGQLFTFTGSADDFDTSLELYDREGYLIDADDDSGPDLNARLVFSLPADGTYYIKILAYAGGTGTYSLSMQAGINDIAIAVPLEANRLTRDYINNSDDIYLESSDYATYGVMFYFDGIANQQIRIDVFAASQGSQIDPFIYLYDASMNILVTDDDSGADYDAQINYSLPATGRYYILVEDLGREYGPESDYWFDILLSR